MAAGDPANLVLGPFKVTWNATFYGLVNEVEPDLEEVLAEVSCGTFGGIPLDHKFLGLKGEVKVNFCEVAGAEAAFSPWSDTYSSKKTLNPAQYASLYAMAKALVLHPFEASDTSVDKTFLKAYPIRVWNQKRDGKGQVVLPVSFLIYPDQSQLALSTPKLVYGTVG